MFQAPPTLLHKVAISPRYTDSAHTQLVGCGILFCFRGGFILCLLSFVCLFRFSHSHKGQRLPTFLLWPFLFGPLPLVCGPLLCVGRAWVWQAPTKWQFVIENVLNFLSVHILFTIKHHQMQTTGLIQPNECDVFRELIMSDEIPARDIYISNECHNICVYTFIYTPFLPFSVTEICAKYTHSYRLVGFSVDLACKYMQNAK